MNILIVPSWYPDKENTNWGYGQINGSFFLEQAHELNKIVNTQIVYIKVHSLRKMKLKNLINFFSISWGLENGIRTFRLNTFNFLPGSTTGLLLQYKIISFFVFRFLSHSKKFDLPDVVHCHGSFFGGAVGIYASKFFKKKLIFTEHSRQLTDYLLPKEVNYYKSLLKNSSKVIALSNDFRNYFRESYHINNNKIEIVPNMIPRIFIDHDHRVFQKNKTFTFIFIGMLIDLKKPLDIIEAFSKINQNEIDSQLKIIGVGNQSSICNQLVSELSLDDRVSFFGTLSRENTLKEIAKSHCLCSVSTTESFGMSILEALTLGLPVISTKSGGPQDLVNNKNGLLVDIGDIDGIADAMTYIFNNYNNFNSDYIRDDALKRFHPNVVSNKLISIYQK